jgi:cell division protein FtsW (lipid II flippase)
MGLIQSKTNIMLHKRSLTLIATFFCSLLTLVSFAQEKSTDINVDINKGGGGSNWYTQPWVWIIGAAVFILLLVALLRGNSSKD